MFRAARAADPDVSRWDVSNVTNMNEIFRSSNAATADVSNWNVSEVTNMKGMFKNCAAKMLDLSKWKLNQELLNSSDKMKNMFESYANIEYLKTPEGLKTDISGANGEFSVVKLKKGVPAAVEQDKQELNSVYQINEGNDKNAVYHIYRNDKYASVFFNKYNGDNEAWANHEIVEQGKSIKESKGSLPAENPELAGNQFVGWSKDKNATTSDFDENTKVDKDTIVYAAWREKQNVNVTFVANGGSGNMEAVQTYKDESYTLPACTFTPPAGKEFDKWSVTVGAAAPVDKQPGEKIAASDNVTVKAVWKEKPVEKVNITFDKTEGEGEMPAVEVNKGSSYKLPECTFTAPEGKEFEKWSVKIGADPAEDKKPNDEIVASDNVTVKAVWKEKTPPAPTKAKVTLDGNGGVLVGGAEAEFNVLAGSIIKEQLEAAVAGNIFTKPGYKLIGFSKSKFALAADYNVDAPVYTNSSRSEERRVGKECRSRWSPYH